MEERRRHDLPNFSEKELIAMENLRQRMKDYPNILFQTDERFLSKYLRFHELDVEKSLKMIIRIYQFKKKYPEWYASGSVTDYLPLLRENHRYIMPKLDKNGRRIFINKLGSVHAKTTIFEMAQLDDMWYEAMLSEYETQIKGLTVIMDFKNLPWTYLKWCQPNWVRIGAAKSDALPLREIDVHVINTSKLMSTIVNIVRPAMPKRIIDKFIFYESQTNWDKLHEAVGRDCLPPEYGGPPEAEIDFEASYQYLLDYNDYLMSNRKYGLKE